MEFTGSITALPGSSPIDRNRWRELCTNHPHLMAIPSRSCRNPFKPGEVMEVRAPADSVRIVVAGQDLGFMEWAQDDSPSINVFGENDSIIPIAQQIASLLSAVFVDSPGDAVT